MLNGYATLSWAMGAGLTATQALTMTFNHPVPEEALRSALGQILKQIDDPGPYSRLELYWK